MCVAETGEVAACDPNAQVIVASGHRAPQKNRWILRGLLLILILAIFFSMGHLAGAFQKEQDILRAKSIVAEKFEIRDSNETLKASLFHGSKGESLLSFFDKTGATPLTLGIDAKGMPTIFLYDGKKTPRIILGVDSDNGEPGIHLFDPDGSSAVSLGIANGSGPHLVIGRKGQGQITISVANGRASSIQISDSMNKPRISFMVSEGDPAILLLGENNTVRSSWQVNSDGSVSFSLFDGQARHRLVIMTDKNGKPTIRFVDPDAKEAKTL